MKCVFCQSGIKFNLSYNTKPRNHYTNILTQFQVIHESRKKITKEIKHFEK